MAQLAGGTRLGPYEIAGPIGAGGMGQVYRARDTRLNRDVAVKCLGPELSGDASSRRRIEREARATASLSHPHICTLFDVGEHDGEMFLVMELIDGQTLADRLAHATRGLPLSEVMTIATQLADALTVAHRHGLVHRDLKPGNIMITKSGAKLLDFGLARPAAGAGDDTRSLITHADERVGTPAYMAPEQLAGTADHRSDIYALGAVMFEMLTGVRAVTGDLTLLSQRPGTPPALDRVVRKCLEKDPERRWQSAADLADELRWQTIAPMGATGPNAAGALGFPTVYLLGAAVAAISAIVAIGWPWRAAAPTTATHLAFVVPEGVAFPVFGAGVAVSPDGSTAAFSAALGTGGGAVRHLFIKRLDAPEVRQVPGTEDAAYPFFSNDGQSIAFFASGKLKKWSASTESVSVIAELGASGFGATGSWGADSKLLFGEYNDAPTEGIRRVAASGGTVEILTRPDTKKNERSHFGPQQLDDGAMLFTIRSDGPNGLEFKVVARTAAGEMTTVIPGASLAKYLGGRRILYQSGATLMLATFDPATLAVSEPRRLVDGVVPTLSAAGWSVGGDVLVYRPVDPPRRRLVWVDRSGTSVPTGLPTRNYVAPFLSPDGNRLAVAVENFGVNSGWIADLRQAGLTQLTEGPNMLPGPWSADGTRLFVSSRNGAALDLVVYRTDGSGTRQVVLQTGEQLYAAALSPDQKTLVVMKPTNGNRDIWLMDLASGTLRPIVQHSGTEYGGRVSPDGKWMSYFSQGASGPFELFVTPFPGGGPRWPISRDGAREAVWSRDGTELFFRQRNQMMSIRVKAGDSFDWEPPRTLFTGAYFAQGGPGNVQYDVAADGRFLMIEELALGSPLINVVQGWSQLAPAR